MQRVVPIVVIIAEILTGLAFAGLMVTVIIQLASRGGLIPAAIWTEEAARFFLLYLAAFGAGLALRSGDMVNVDLVSESLPGRWPWRLRLLSAIIVAGLCAMLVPSSWTYTAIGLRQTSPALGIGMHFIHATVLLLLALLGIFALLRALAMIAGAEDGRAIRSEED